MSDDPKLQTQKTLRLSIIDGATYSLMVGTGETYLAAFALALGFSQVMSGLVSVIPILIGSALQFIGIYGPFWLKSKRKWVVGCAVLQAVALIGFGSMGFTDAMPALFLFFLSSLYWASGLAAGQSWNAWIGSLVPKELRISFFSTRSRVMQAMTLLSLMGASACLEYSKSRSYYLATFGFLFVLSALFRLFSAYSLSLHPDRQARSIDREKMGWKKAWVMVKEKPIRNTILFLFVTQVAVQISAPYFNPYMLKQLQLNYHWYMVLLGTALLARITTYRWLADLGKRKGVSAIVIFGAIGVIPLPFLWTLSDNPWFLVLFQALSGFAWGAYELGTFLMLLENHEEEIRTWMLAIVNFLNALGMTLGSLLGGYLIKNGASSKEIYHSVFYLSSALRILPLFLLPAMIKQEILFGKIYMKIFSILPGAGLLSKPTYYEKPKDNRPSNPG